MNPILNSSNAKLVVTNISPVPENRMPAPLGTADGSATGEVGTKVVVIGNGTATPGIPITPPTVSGVKVVGIAETRTYQKALTAATTTISAGALAITVIFSSDFVGTIGTLDYTGATQAAYSDAAQPGNVLPSIAITRSAGSYSIITAGAT